ncbi:MAG: hypothetical protein QXV17_08255 [Candidatus Micrarchaeaceae archaeon]
MTSPLPAGTYQVQYLGSSPNASQPLNGTQVGTLDLVITDGTGIGIYNNAPYYENSNGFYYVPAGNIIGNHTYSIAANGFSNSEVDGTATVSASSGSSSSGSGVTATTTITETSETYTLQLTANPSTISSGQSVTLTATISPVDSGSINAPVTFNNLTLNTIIGNCTIDSSGSCSITYTPPPNTSGQNETIQIQAEAVVS